MLISEMKNPSEENILNYIKENNNRVELKKLQDVFIFDGTDEYHFYKCLGKLKYYKRILALDKNFNMANSQKEVVYIETILL